MSAETTSCLASSAGAIVATALELGQTRLQLACTELEEERLRLARQCLFAVAALFFAGISLVLASILIVVLAGPERRCVALALLTVVHSGISVGLALAWHRSSRCKPPLLAATMETLRGDLKALRQARSAAP